MIELFTCAIVDDNPESIENLCEHLSLFSNIEIVHKESDPLIAQQKLLEKPVDLLFVDIEMPRMSGIQLVQSLPFDQKTIFVTAHEQYAAESFETDAIDYLLKPVPFDRFAKATHKAMRLFDMENVYQKATKVKNDYIFFKDIERKMLDKVEIDDITYIEAQRNYITIYRLHNHLQVRKKITALMEDLPEELFAQVHRSYVVARKMIKKVQSTDIILKYSEKAIPLGRKYRKNLN